MKKHILILSALILSFAQPVFADGLTGQLPMSQIGTGGSQCSILTKNSATVSSSDVSHPVSNANVAE